MRDFVQVTGMVIKAIPVGEYDRAVTILTNTRGKISAFARNCRKMNNRLMAATNPFCFGTFKLYEGRNSYTIADAEITRYFEELRTDLEAAYYGMYFLEISDYYARENNDEVLMLKLLYQSLRALLHPGLDHELVRRIFECKAMAVNGEYPGVPSDEAIPEVVSYALQFIGDTPVEKLYTFTIDIDARKHLAEIVDRYKEQIWNHKFKSLEVLREFLC